MDGIIVINKPKNCTSHDIVYKTKKILQEKVGHTGTLDPNATGVLPLLIGKGTQISKYLINHDKIYQAQIQLGEKRTTGDIEGEIIEQKEVNESNLKKENIESVLKNFKGKQNQIPPIYSAIKVNGKKLYEYARKGENIEIEPREIEIYNIKLLNIDKINKTIDFEVECSKGTYIRSLCEDIAEKLGSIGYMKELKRIKVGEFDLKDSMTIEEIEKNINNKEFLKNKIISIEQYFKNNPSLELQENKIKLLLNGVQLEYNLEDNLYKIYNSQKEFIGLATIKNKLLKRDVILN